jgi:type III secretory pathway component EscT
MLRAFVVPVTAWRRWMLSKVMTKLYVSLFHQNGGESTMVKVLRVVIMVLALQALFVHELGVAQAPYCQTALQRCLSQCERFPALFREGCMMGCGIGYLGCG